MQVVSEAGDIVADRAPGRRLPPARAGARRQHARRLQHPGDPADPRGRAGDPDRRADDADRPRLAREALRAGATGFVLKEAAEAELIQAVRLAAEGRTYLNPELGARLAAERPAAPGRPTTSAPARSRCCG